MNIYLYPFTGYAERYIFERYGKIELKEMFERYRNSFDIAKSRIEMALKDLRIDMEKLYEYATNKDEILLSYNFAKVIVSTLSNSVIKRYALAEAKTAYENLNLSLIHI